MQAIRATPRNLAIASLVLFAVHLPLLLIVRGEFTDGYLQAVYFDPPLYQSSAGAPPARYVPPLYPGLIWCLSSIGLPPLLSGRLLSMVAYAMTGYILGLFARQLSGRFQSSPDSIAWSCWAFWAVAPVATRWSYHCMTDMSFCCLAAGSLALLLSANMEGTRNPQKLWVFGNLFAILAFWTRYQGLALFLASAVCLLLMTKKKEGPSPVRILSVFPVILAWCFSFGGLSKGLAIHGQQFTDRSVYGWEVYGTFVLAAFRWFPYAVTPPILILAVLGLLLIARSTGGTRVWFLLGLVGALVGLGLQTWFDSFQFRYGLPLLPWVCLFAAIGLQRLPTTWLKPAMSVSLIWSLAMSLAVIIYQHETFADIGESAAKISELGEDAGEIWACEVYNESYSNIKISAVAGLPVSLLTEERLGEITPGDLIVHPNTYQVPGRRLEKLRERWDLRVVAETTSETIPLFPGEVLSVQMKQPRGIMRILTTRWRDVADKRYTRQYYHTTVYRVADKVPN